MKRPSSEVWSRSPRSESLALMSFIAPKGFQPQQSFSTSSFLPKVRKTSSCPEKVGPISPTGEGWVGLNAGEGNAKWRGAEKMKRILHRESDDADVGLLHHLLRGCRHLWKRLV